MLLSVLALASSVTKPILTGVPLAGFFVPSTLLLAAPALVLSPVPTRSTALTAATIALRRKPRSGICPPCSERDASEELRPARGVGLPLFGSAALADGNGILGQVTVAASPRPRPAQRA